MFTPPLKPDYRYNEDNCDLFWMLKVSNLWWYFEFFPTSIVMEITNTLIWQKNIFLPCGINAWIVPEAGERRDVYDQNCFKTINYLWSIMCTDITSDYVKAENYLMVRQDQTFLVLSGSEFAPSVLIAGLPGCGWGREYPSSCSMFSAAALLASFLFGPLPCAFWVPTVTCNCSQIIASYKQTAHILCKKR